MSEKEDMLFLSLVYSLSAAAYHQMGKIASPVSGKVERNLPQAKMSIDILISLREKTKGNLIPKEEKMLADSLADLELNYVEEVKKEGDAAPPPPPGEQS